MNRGRIRVGIGGWSYEPWRETFYPPDVPRSRELEYASGVLSAIEVNATFYRAQKPGTFARWRDATPDGFMFTLKAPRHATHRKTLADAQAAVERFLASGVAQLRHKLGPILWQLEPRHAFEPRDLERFFGLLPREADGLRLRHALEVRHESFAAPAFIDLARRHGVAIVFAEHAAYPAFAQVTAEFVYARLMLAQSPLPEGYADGDLERWAERAHAWAAGGLDVFLFFIGGAKEKNPAAARALLAKVRSASKSMSGTR